MWRNWYYRLRFAGFAALLMCSQAAPHYKTCPPPGCFHGFLLPPFPSFLFETALRSPNIDRLLHPPRRRPTTRSIFPTIHLLRRRFPTPPLHRAPSIDSSARPGAFLTVSGIADLWNLLEPTCLVMDTASMLTRSTEPGVCRYIWSKTSPRRPRIQFYDLATQLTP